MIRIGLLSEDAALQSSLSSVMGKEFRVQLATTEKDIRRIVDEAECDVTLLDLTSGSGDSPASDNGLKERISSFRRIVGLQAPVVILADDSLRSTAIELVRLGAYGYCRRP